MKKVNDSTLSTRNIQLDYQKKHEELKLKGDELLAQAAKSNADRVEIHKNETDKKIQQMQKKYVDYKDHLNREKELLDSNQKELLQNSTDGFQERLINVNNNAEQQINETSTNAANSFKALVTQHNNTLNSFTEEAKGQIHSKQSDKLNQIHNLAQELEHKKFLMNADFQKKILKQTIDSNKELMHHQHRQNEKLHKTNAEHEYQTNQQIKGFKEKLQKTNLDFDKKYNEILANHSKEYSLLNTKMTNDIEDLKNQLSKKKSVVTDKMDDPFYKISRLDPLIQDRNDHYIVALKVPNYEKDFIKASGHGRELRLTFTRNFQDEIDNKEGNVAKFNRNESYSQTLKLTDLIDPKRIVKMRQEDLTIFVIPKL